MRTLRVLSMLALAGALSAPGLSSAELPVFKTDHFKCYPVLRGNPANEFVELEDQFDRLHGIQEQVLVGNPVLFCNPVIKIEPTGQATQIKNINNHLKLYLIQPPTAVHPVIQSADQPRPTFLARKVDVENQFGVQQLLVTHALLLAVPAQKRPHESPGGLDHFKCYPARGQPFDKTYQLQDQFDPQPEPVRLVRAVLFCNPAQKTHHGQVAQVQNPAEHLTCYGIVLNTAAGIAPRPPIIVQAQDQFLKDRFYVRRARYLCVPTVKVNHFP